MRETEDAERDISAEITNNITAKNFPSGAIMKTLIRFSDYMQRYIAVAVHAIRPWPIRIMLCASCCLFAWNLWAQVAHRAPNGVQLGPDIYIENPAPPSLHPTMAFATREHTLIIGGDQGVTDWAQEVDRSGAIIWTYVGEGQDRGTLRDQTIIFGGAEVSGGRIDLCMRRKLFRPGDPLINLIQLDANGRPLGRRPIDLSLDVRDSMVSLLHCGQLGDGVLLAGNLVRNITAAPTAWVTSFWMMKIDAVGHVEWEQEYSLHKKFTPIRDDTTVVMGPNYIALAASDNAVTEMIEVDPKGRFIASVTLAGRYQLIDPVDANHTLEAFGTDHSDLSPPFRIIQFDRVLRTQHIYTTDFKQSFLARNLFGLNDGTYLISGTEVLQSAPDFRSEAVLFRQHTHVADNVYLQANDINDGGVIPAATRIDNLQSFLTARDIGDQPPPDCPLNVGNKGRCRYKHGMYLNFIDVLNK